MPAQLESIRIVARRLEPLEVPFAFLGGAVVCLLVDRPDLMESLSEAGRGDVVCGPRVSPPGSLTPLSKSLRLGEAATGESPPARSIGVSHCFRRRPILLVLAARTPHPVKKGF